ncbi:ArsR/SmtB family transcription factor [Aminipila sp.]|uniref:ArsR/SmtB family transcription factor n=1 Tax=Aminipila sp. TaxID=2060095 RepID=UPI0028A2771C|nr:metalloregulator ArsR/SmtB family transcription factor [Aminipila sp.]
MEVVKIDTQFSNYTSCFKALSDELRFNILFYLYESEEKCVCSLTEYFKTSQSALSYHLKILADNGLLIKRQEAVWNFYALNKEHFIFPILEKAFKNQSELSTVDGLNMDDFNQ